MKANILFRSMNFSADTVHHYRYRYIFLKGDPLHEHRIKGPAVFISAHLLLGKNPGEVEQLKLALSYSSVLGILLLFPTKQN